MGWDGTFQLVRPACVIQWPGAGFGSIQGENFDFNLFPAVDKWRRNVALLMGGTELLATINLAARKLAYVRVGSDAWPQRTKTRA
jgi:hypothetical protein